MRALRVNVIIRYSDLSAKEKSGQLEGIAMAEGDRPRKTKCSVEAHGFGALLLVC